MLKGEERGEGGKGMSTGAEEKEKAVTDRQFIEKERGSEQSWIRI